MSNEPTTTGPSADRADDPEIEAPAGDPELAALVRSDARQDDGGPSPDLAPAAAGSPSPDADEQAPVAAEAIPAGSATAGAAATDAISADPPAPGEPTDTNPTDTSPTSERGAAAPVLPLAAAATVGEPSAQPRRRRSIGFRFGVAFVLGVLLALGLGGGVLYAWGQQYDGRVLPGVRIGSTDLGGLTREQAEAKIASAYASLGTGQITLNGPDAQVTTISYADLGRGPDTSALLDAAISAGRNGEPLADLIGAPRAAIHGMTLDPAVAYDHDKLAAAVETLATRIDQTPVDAAVSADPGGTFSVSPAKEGRAVDKTALLAGLDQQLAALGTPASITMAVPVVSLAPAVATASADTAKAAADRMVADVVVARGSENWTIARSTLAPMVSFSNAADGTIAPVFDSVGLDPILKMLAKQVNQKVQDAGLERVGGHVVATGASHEGRTLNASGMKNAIVSEIWARQAGTPGSPVAAIVKAVNPKLTAQDAAAFAPKMRVISSFSVYYFVIINNHFGGNIEAPATKIDGTVVPPGQIFDFWKVVGDLHKLPGEGPGNAIEGGKITVTGAFGGGICTTSTTLFNAAFRAGMVPLARQNHNEFINRYPPGLDATVWIVGTAKQTMSFRNDTKYPILIQRIITNAGSRRWITFKIWSVPNGRTYKISNLVIQHGPRAIDTVVRDRTKPVGYAFRNNTPVDGAKVWVTVSIYDHGKLHWSRRYYSRYPAVNGVLVVGAKT